MSQQQIEHTDQAGFFLIDLARIHPSPTNPRKRFDEASLAELAASIKQKGVLQPVLVRPRRTGPDLALTVHDVYGLLPSAADALVAADIATLSDLVERAKVRYPDQWEKKPAGGIYAAARSVPGVQAVDAKHLSRLFEPAADPPQYELIAGERRYRAAKLAGEKTLPCIVRELSDRDVLEIQCVENEQREDVLPSERAAAP